MRSHRLASTTLLVVATAFAATGCGSGRDSEAFLPDAPAAVAEAPETTAVPQVVVAGPKQALLDARDAAAAEAKASREAAAKAEAKRKAARTELRKERTKAKRIRKRAAAREALLQTALLAAEKQEKKSRVAAEADVVTPKPDRRPASAPISASDTGSTLVAERNRRSDAESRAAVVRFHELLDRHDARSCELLTDKLLTAVYGDEDPLARCQAAVASITTKVSVVIAESTTQGKASSVAVVTRIGDQEFPQTMHLVLVDGSWLFDAVERRSTT